MVQCSLHRLVLITMVMSSVNVASIYNGVHQYKKLPSKRQPFTISLRASAMTLRGGHSGDDSDENMAWPQILSDGCVLVVMRGTPESPECTDSAEIVSLCAEAGLTFDHYNVLRNESIQLPIWPPLPQAARPSCPPLALFLRRPLAICPL